MAEYINGKLNLEELDEGVRKLVEYFNSVGLKTVMSCQGHNTTNMSMFWIQFSESVTVDDIDAFLINLNEKYGSLATCGRFAMRTIPLENEPYRRWYYMAATQEAANSDYTFFTTGRRFLFLGKDD